MASDAGEVGGMASNVTTPERRSVLPPVNPQM